MEHQDSLLRIGILGWIGRGNVGDELLRSAISSFIIAAKAVPVPILGCLDHAMARGLDALIIGGGSLLDGRPDIEPGLALKLPLAYVSVGLETDIHPEHASLLCDARLVMHRSPEARGEELHRRLQAKGSWFSAPDAVYTMQCCTALHNESFFTRKELLVLPNMEVIPTWTAPHWMHLAWDRFKDEFAQFLDDLYEDGWRPRFMSSCLNPRQDDNWAASEIISRMTRRSPGLIERENLSAEATVATSQVSRYRLVISQRFHGAVLARMAQVPCMAIYHHDKIRELNPSPEACVPYHGITKDGLHKAFNVALSSVPEEFPMSDVYHRHVAEFISTVDKRVGADEAMGRL